MFQRIESRHPASPATLIHRYPGALFIVSLSATYIYGRFIYSEHCRVFSHDADFTAFSSVSPFLIRDDMIIISVLLVLTALSLLPFIRSLERVSSVSTLELPRHAILFLEAYVGFGILMIVVGFVSCNVQLAQWSATYPASRTLPYIYWADRLGLIALPVLIACPAFTLHLKSYGFHHEGLFALIWAIFATALRFEGKMTGSVLLFGVLLVLCAFSLQSWFRELLAYNTKPEQPVLPYED